MHTVHSTLIANAARNHEVSPAIHPDDHIFRFLIEHEGFPSDEARIGYYFDDGRRSAEQFLGILDRHVNIESAEVLEFASGYGCVTRHLVKRLGSHIQSCDIHSQAIEFLRHEIGVAAIQSAEQPEMLQLNRCFDVVFALSFFSHMPITTWARWLVRLTQATKPSGIIVFTTQGLYSRKFFGEPEIPEIGFWFSASSEQKDLPTEQYGQTIVTPEFVKKHVFTIPHAELIEHREGYWWGHQDLYVLRKTEAD